LSVHSPRNLFAHDGAHAAADELRFHRADIHPPAFEFALGRYERIVERGGGLAGLEPFAIGLLIDEMERIGREKTGVSLF